jgi:general secretion pathway protein K
MIRIWRRPHSAKNNDGFIVVAVMWLLAALATLAVIYSLYVRQSVASSVDYDERLQGQALATAGVEIAVFQITSNGRRRPLQGHFNFRQGSAAVEAHFMSENGHIDLNFAPKDVLTSLFLGFGVPIEAAQEFSDRIAMWRTPLKPGADDPEADLYRQAGKNYRPRHGMFQHVEELGLVADIPPWLIDKATPYLTVYSGRPEINVAIAPPAVIAALPGIKLDRLQALLGQSNMPQDVLRAQLGTTASYITLLPCPANRVTVEVRFPTHRFYRTEAVVLVLDNDVQPYRVLSWRDGEITGERQQGL